MSVESRKEVFCVSNFREVVCGEPVVNRFDCFWGG